MNFTEDIKTNIDLYFESTTAVEAENIAKKYGLVADEYVSLPLSLRLKNIGYDYPSNMMYCHNYRVKDEILKKIPNLSDDGYLELTKDYGGLLDEEDVYGYYDEAIYCHCMNDKFHFENYPDMLCVCPKYTSVIEWLRTNNNIYVNIYPDIDNFNKVIYSANIIFVQNDNVTCLTTYHINDNDKEYYSVCEKSILLILKILENE